MPHQSPALPAVASPKRSLAISALLLLLASLLTVVNAPRAQAYAGLDFLGGVNVSLEAPDGSLYVGGNFDTVGGITRALLVKLNPNGTVDTNFDANIQAYSGDVNVLALQDGWLYVGGSYLSDTSSNLGRVNPATGAFDTSWQFTGGTIGAVSVSDMEFVGSDLYVSGKWAAFGGVTGRSVVKMSKTSTAADANWGSQFTATTGDTSALEMMVDGSKMYVAGAFSTVGGVSRPGLVALNMSDGSVDSSFDPGLANGTVLQDAVMVGNYIYFGGSQVTFTSGPDRNRLAAVNKNTGAVASWNPAPPEPEMMNISGLAADSAGNIYVGGYFNNFGSPQAPRASIAAVQNATDTNPGKLLPWNPMATGGPVFSITVSGTGATTKIYLNGIFTNVGNSQTPSNGVAAPILYPQGNGNGRLAALAGASVTIPPQAKTVNMAGNTLTWTDGWLGGQQYAYVLYKRSTDANVMKNWKIYAYGKSVGDGTTPKSLLIAGFCPSGWTCPRPIGLVNGTTYNFNVIMRSYTGNNSAGPNSARASYTYFAG